MPPSLPACDRAAGIVESHTRVRATIGITRVMFSWLRSGVLSVMDVDGIRGKPDGRMEEAVNPWGCTRS